MCCNGVWSQNQQEVYKQGFAGLQQNIDISCSLSDSEVFWIVNGSVYGALQVPREFVVCGARCNLRSLTIPVAQREMDGFTFQCVGIDYHDNSTRLGEITVLNVTPLEGHNGIYVL